MSSTPSDKTIYLSRFQHRGAPQIRLQFAFNQEIKSHLMRLPFMRWSQTHRCFYISDRPDYLEQFKSHCKGVVQMESKKRPANVPGTIKRKVTRQSPERSVKPRKEKKQVPLRQEVKTQIEVVKHWMQQKRYSANTIKTYISFIHSFFADHPHLEWDAVTEETILNYNHKQFIEEGRSYSTQNQWINAIRLYLKVHHLDIGDLEDIERPRRGHYLPEVLSEEEVMSIFKAVGNLKHKALLMLLYSSGLRIGEALKIRLFDIRSEEGLIYIRNSKGAKDRRVPLSAKMLEILRSYHQAYQPKNYLFEGWGGRPYSHSSANKVLKEALRKAGIERRITLHTLRHSYATHVTNRGVNIQYLQEILGHQSPKTTMLYTHLSGKDIRNIKSPLDEMDI